jgi:hypothetical protein
MMLKAFMVYHRLGLALFSKGQKLEQIMAFNRRPDLVRMKELDEKFSKDLLQALEVELLGYEK